MAKTETVVESVKMSDGRIVDFPGKKRLQKDSFIGDDGSVSVRCDFRNGETLDIKLMQSMLAKYAAHGAEQKLGDEIAGVEDLDDAVLAVSDLIDRLNKGEWTVAREANGMAGTSILLQAIMAVKGLAKEKVQAYLKDKTQAQKIALRNSPTFADKVKELEAAKAAGKKTVDVTAELAELDALA